MLSECVSRLLPKGHHGKLFPRCSKKDLELLVFDSKTGRTPGGNSIGGFQMWGSSPGGLSMEYIYICIIYNYICTCREP